MQVPLQISLKKLDRSLGVEAKVRDRVEELEQFFGRLMSCRVVIEAASRRPRQGRLYRVRTDLKVPGKEIVVSQGPSQHQAHEDGLYRCAGLLRCRPAATRGSRAALAR